MSGESNPVAEKVIHELGVQTDQHGYFACFRGSEAYAWMCDHGLILLGRTRLRIFNSGALAGEEFYEVYHTGQLMRMHNGQLFDPMQLLASKKAKQGWEVHDFNRESLTELRAE